MLHGAGMILPWPHEHAQAKVRHLRSIASSQEGLAIPPKVNSMGGAS